MTKRILIAEDDPDILFILDMILNDAGYAVEPLPEGSSIIDRKKNWPDLFILDEEMPTIDGFSLCRFLKLNQETKNIPIIMISAYHMLRERAREAGADDFIEKPFNLKDLLATIHKHTDDNDTSTIVSP